MSWLDPFVVFFFLLFCGLALISLIYFISGIYLVVIGKKEGNDVKRRSGVRAIFVSGFLLAIFIRELTKVEYYSLPSLMFGSLLH